MFQGMYFFAEFNATFSLCCTFLQLQIFAPSTVHISNSLFIKQTTKVSFFLLLSDIKKNNCMQNNAFPIHPFFPLYYLNSSSFMIMTIAKGNQHILHSLQC